MNFKKKTSFHIRANDPVNFVRQLIIKSILRYIPYNSLLGVYAIGSFASDEATIMNCGDSDEIYISDFDGIIDVTPTAYFKYYFNRLAENLSQMLTVYLRSNGLRTHVSLTITCFKLSKLFSSLKPNTVSLYELRPLISRKESENNLNALRRIPSRVDIINLVYSSIADYVFTYLMEPSSCTVAEKCYIIAKRCLTLLYSLMLFNGIYPNSYTERIALAKKHFNKLAGVLTYNDIEILEVLTDYKLSGNLFTLIERLPLDERTSFSVLEFLNDFFKGLALKILKYELSNCKGDEFQKNRHITDLTLLLRNHKLMFEIKSPELAVYVWLYTFSCLKNKCYNRFGALLFSLLREKLKIEDWIRYLISLVFISSVQKNKFTDLQTAITLLKTMWDSFMK
jgi:hypothetical protein